MAARYCHAIFAVFSLALLLPPQPALAATAKHTLAWAGCGITKKAFMSQLASAYQKKTGIKIVLHGGGATRGIRDTMAGRVDMGGSCRMTLPSSNRS
ncbi:MAG: hypothetical protein P8Z67_04740 [Gammaproteobacteria bacterium]